MTSILPAFEWGDEESRQRGTHIHKACYLLNHDALDWMSVHPAYEPYVRGYEKLLKETGFKPDRSELTVISERYGVGGTLDVTGRLGGQYVLADIKSGNNATKSPSHELQVAAYYNLYMETTGDRRKRKLYVFYLLPNDYRLLEMTEKDAWQAFLGYLKVHYWEERWK